MAKLKAFVAKLEDVPEAQRELYVEDTDSEGKARFKLDADGLEDVTGLKNTVKALRKENGDIKKKFEPFAEIAEDADIEAILQVGRETLEARKTGKPAPEVESVTKQLNTAHAKEKAKLQGTIDAQTETLREVLIEQEVKSVLGEKDTKGNAALLLPVVKERAKVVEYDDNGKKKFRASIIGEDGHERIDGKGKPFTVKALLAELKATDDYSDAFDGTGASGSGATTDGGGRTPTPPRTPAAPVDDAKAAKRRSQDYQQI